MDSQSSYASMEAAAGAQTKVAPLALDGTPDHPSTETPAQPFVNDRICSLREVKTLTGDPSTSSIYRWIDQGIFPRQRRVGINRVGWLYSEVMRYVSQCEAA